MGRDVFAKMLALLERGDQFGNKVILGLQLFCQHEQARKELRKLGATFKISSYHQSGERKVKQVAITITSALQSG
jgi:hypothetical protein